MDFEEIANKIEECIEDNTIFDSDLIAKMLKMQEKVYSHY